MLRYRHNPYSLDKTIIYETRPVVDARRAIYSPRRLADWHIWLREEYERPVRRARRHARFPHNLGEYLEDE
ncbi:hypothetical protein AGDE_17131 [Angomonas deanei]|nr:hypothetical protein AGDE_17131 [Angomonas deanei]|eukprot:EPY15409.1 hypothetical protein AGDE_17131 [Angomonas deanei]